MKGIIKISLLLLFVFGGMTVANAQKVGYINSSAILQEMPKVKEMRSNLEALRSQLQKQGQKMVEEFQAKQAAAGQKEERGELSPKEKEVILKDLQERQEKILAFEKEMQEKLVTKEQELLNPILEAVNGAIEQVAKENNYKFILESSVLIYGDEGLDVTDLVKAKL